MQAPPTGSAGVFEAAMVEGTTLRAKIAHKGWRVVQSINGVPTERILALAEETAPATFRDDINELLPSVMAMTDAPLAGESTVVVANAVGEQETLTIEYFHADRGTAVEAFRKGVEGFLALGKAAGFTRGELDILFASTLIEFNKVAEADGETMEHMMGSAMESAMGNMGQRAAEMAAGADGQNCQAQ